MNNAELVKEINQQVAITAAPTIDMSELEVLLALHINELIRHNFQKLLTVLYRVDVSELKLKQLLEHNSGDDAGRIIAMLLIERQLQKIETRKQYRGHDNDFNEEEKW